MQTDLEQIAEIWLRKAGFSVDVAPNPVAVADALLGPGAVRLARVGDQPPRLAILSLGEARDYILVRRGLNKNAIRWAVFHELGHWIARRETMDDQDEHLADALGALLRAPRAAFSRAVDAHGEDWSQLALEFRTSQTSAVLRFAEVTSEPTALVTASSVRLRGRPHPWPEADRLKLAPKGDVPGLRRCRLTDNRARWALRAA